MNKIPKLLPFALLFLHCSTLLAQVEDDSITWSLAIEDIVVTAQFAPTAKENAVHEVKVIEIEDITRQGMNNLAEVLTQQLNFRVSNDPILGSGAQIQGVGGENVQVAIDGIPVIGRVNGNVDLSQIKLSDVDHIEIVEGALSAQYGNNAAGGVINIITKKTQLNKYNVSLASQFEDIGIMNYDALFSARFNRFFFSASGSHYQSQFEPNDSLRLIETTTLADGSTLQQRKFPWNPKVQNSLNGKLTYRPNDSFDITYQQRYFTESVFLYGPVKRPSFNPYAFDETYLTNRHDHTVSLNTWLSSSLYLQSQTALNSFTRTKQYERLELESRESTPVSAEQDTSRFTSVLHRTSINTAGQQKINGQFGVEYLREMAFGRRLVDTSAVDLNEPSQQNIAFWLGARWTPITKLILQASVRYGHNSQFDHPVLPALNLRWNITEDWTLKSSYALGFRAPSIKELHFNFIDINHFIVGNNELQAEYSNNARLSLDYRNNLGNNQLLRLGVKGFYNTIRNKITLAEFAPLQYNYQNLETYATHGLNFTINYESKIISCESGFSITNIANDFAEEPQYEPTFVPVAEVQSRLSVWIPKVDIDFLVTHRYIARQQRYHLYEDEILLGFIGQNHQLNATLNRHFWQERIHLSIGAKNLLNQSSRSLSGASNSGDVHGGSGQSVLTGFDRSYFVRLQFSCGK
ncbi:TonB-dependent receptor plug domain-containing protein [Lewinella cohaerens]|uniref:TonB-dependent receptor plug domain-containing protein n=1 Tax=Lewinella cohaerens TaxID=70995 RepID=UPI000363EAAA|nr:TonB-dependent receptor [Lewinella cohaerens]